MGTEGPLRTEKTPERGSPRGYLDARMKTVRMSGEEGVEPLGGASAITTTVLERRR